MQNHYLHIKEDGVSYADNVFSGFGPYTKTKFKGFCLQKAKEMRTSDLGNFTALTKKQREELAKRWEAAKDLPEGMYEYYFNLEDRVTMFKQAVKELAEKLGISYKMEKVKYGLE